MAAEEQGHPALPAALTPQKPGATREVAMSWRATPETAGQEADLWQGLRDKFQALAKEQRDLLRTAQQGNRLLRAACSYNSDMTPAESALVQGGLACLLYRLESGTWQLGEGPNEDFKARFETLATRAGKALQPPPGIVARDFWLHDLCLHLRRTGNKGFFGGSDTGSYIEDVCQTSATFCSWLERKALEQANAPKLLGFAHSKDYISVALRGKSYTLTSRQAQMIEILHRAHESGKPDVAIHYILESLGTSNSRWQDTFKSNPAAKKALIRAGTRRGTLRLNL